jgi:uncharacterized membrane protein YfhO
MNIRLPMMPLRYFSEVFYDKGWKAYVDGKETPIIRADYILKSTTITAGTHKVEFVLIQSHTNLVIY